MTNNTDLLTLLQKLGGGEIDDLSIAHDAMEEIVHLRIRVDELYEDKERWYRMCELHTVRLQELQAELDALKRNNSYCPMCGAGTVPSVPAPAQEPLGYWLTGTDVVEFGYNSYHDGDEWEPLFTTPPAPAQLMCGAGTVPSVPDDTALLRQAAETIDELMYSSSTPIAAVKAGDVMIALKERLK